MQTQLVAGETLNYSFTVAGYPASAGWVVTLYMNPRAGGTNITVAATASGDDHLLQVGSSVTEAWIPGMYGWEVWATLAGERKRIESGQLEVMPGLLSAAAGTDTRTEAQRALAEAKAACAAWTPTTRRYKINGREMEYSSAAEIQAVITYWRNRVRIEHDQAAIAAGRPTSGKVLVQLGRA